MQTLNVDDSRELIPIKRFKALGGVPLVAKELERRAKDDDYG